MLDRILGESLATRIRALEQKNQAFSVTPISDLGTWQEIAEPVTYTSATVMRRVNNNVDMRNIYQVGDAIRAKQGGGYKYFSVVNVAAPSVTFATTADYSLSSAPITDLARGKSAQPDGFPYEFSFAPNLNSGGVGTVTSVNYIERSFFVERNIMHLNINIQFESGGGGQDAVFIDLPALAHNYGSAGSVFVGACLVVGSTFTPDFGYAYLASGGSNLELGIVPGNDIYLGAGQAVLGQIQYRLG